MSGHYCPKCGTLHSRLPAGFVTCGRCGALGLRGYDGSRPKRVKCPLGCSWSGWDDGGVNDDVGRHLRRDHKAMEEP